MSRANDGRQVLPINLKTVLVIEVNYFHTEVFPIYAEYLPTLLNERDLRITYLTHEWSARQFKDSFLKVDGFFGRLQSKLLQLTGHYESAVESSIEKLINNSKPDVLVFNSIEPEKPHKLFRALSRNVSIAIGISHNPELLDREGDRKNAYYFCLSKVVYNHYREKLDGYMLPFFKQYDVPGAAPAGAGCVRIGIQGHVDFARRDYPLLVETAQVLLSVGYTGVQFNIIGTLYREKLMELTQSAGVSGYFIFHEKLDDKAFFSQVASCHFIMPLLGTAQSDYFVRKTTASYSHSAAYRIPMILSKDNAVAWGLSKSECMIYDDASDLARLLMELRADDNQFEKYSAFVEGEISVNHQLLSGGLASLR